MERTPSAGDVKSQPPQAPPDPVGESATMKQMTTLVGLMRQQMEWSMRSEDAKREHGIGAAEALETRMREMEVWYMEVWYHAQSSFC